MYTNFFSLSNCYYQVNGMDTGGLWSQTTMNSTKERQLRLLTVNGRSDFGRERKKIFSSF